MSDDDLRAKFDSGFTDYETADLAAAARQQTTPQPAPARRVRRPADPNRSH